MPRRPGSPSTKAPAGAFPSAPEGPTARPRPDPARAARARRPAGLQSVSILSQPLEFPRNAKKWISKSFNGLRTLAKRRDRGPVSARGCSGSPMVPRRSPPAGIVLGAWRVRFPRDALRPGSRAPRPGSRAPHEPAAPPTSNPFQFSRSPLNSHKTRKNGFPNPSTATGPGRRGGIAAR